jgi:hypothetical protein
MPINILALLDIIHLIMALKQKLNVKYLIAWMGNIARLLLQYLLIALPVMHARLQVQIQSAPRHAP